MPLQLVPSRPADARRIAQIEHEAYAPNPNNKILFPGPFPDNVLDYRAEEMASALKTDDSVRWLKVIDTELEGDDALISFAQWNIWPSGAPTPKPRVFGPGTNPAACEALFGGIAACRARHMGERPYVYLRYLHTDPKHQGRGAGKLLVQWGVDEAQRLGLPAYLEGTDAAHNLYLNCGFKDIDTLDVDMSKYGGDGIHRTYNMLRKLA